MALRGPKQDGEIAIVAWGSLMWDPDTLAPRVTGPWALRAGPRLPMEFSRISIKRKMGLVVCLDPAAGVPCATHAIRSVRFRIDEAVADLALRERSPLDRIGWATLDGHGHGRLPALVRAARDWCADGGWSGAVWTDLEPNFETVTGAAFSVPAGIDYLKGLTGDSLAEGLRYIRNAPPTTRTPLRRALVRDPWWRALHQRRSTVPAPPDRRTLAQA